ncbi:MAG: sulfatase-like hydrolase/transferase [Candidatus Hydrogenedentes bacterium]|nr:sulfatase-like hydrolase/transferase [Candidatus Hydrogenedentota bacterium]
MSSTSISRKEFMARVALGGAALALSARGQEPVQPGRRPNFLVILTDDLAYRAVGYNNSAVKTPNLDRLAGEGIIFDRTYIATPICAASRASLLTGVFPQQHGSVGLDPEGFHRSAIEERRFPTLAHTLSGAGYHTAFCGKSHLGPPRDYGFIEGEEHKDGTDDEPLAWASRFLAGRQGDETPFLLWVALRQPHIPLKPGPEWLKLYESAELPIDPNFLESPPPESQFNQGLPGEHFYREWSADAPADQLRSGPPRTREQLLAFMRVYYATISRMDSQVGALIGALKASGHYENTVIFFLSDNGYHLGNHGLGNKITMHEEAVRVPMFIHWARMRSSGKRSESLVSSLDIYPTMLDLAGVGPLPHLAGLPLTPLFQDPAAQLRVFAASECVGVGGKPGMGHRMVRTKNWKYVLTDSNEEVLFDESGDPYEMTNAVGATANADALAAHRRYMSEWMKTVGDTHAPPPET